MAKIVRVGSDATEITIDGLNAVLIIGEEPIAAKIAGKFYFRTMSNDVFEWMGGFEGEAIQVEHKPKDFFDNILTIYMNPAALDALENGE